jgi:peptidoglycan biosynthesis protein MviN/MurJ (putative lipid II flippase)
VLPAQLLLLVVLVRISTASANLILKGTGGHKLLAYTNSITALVNVLLSIGLARPLGLVGIAVGTLIPVAASTLFVIYPAACRRVGLSIARPLMDSIWPAMWPALVMALVLWFARELPPGGLFGVAVHLAAGGLVYLALFLVVAIGAEERRFYWTKLRGLVTRQRRTPAAA